MLKYPAILPNFGTNGGYFYQLSDGTLLEFEVGYHPAILFDKSQTHFLLYFSAGISFK